jgi:hypothetical protein
VPGGRRAKEFRQPQRHEQFRNLVSIGRFSSSCAVRTRLATVFSCTPNRSAVRRGLECIGFTPDDERKVPTLERVA